MLDIARSRDRSTLMGSPEYGLHSDELARVGEGQDGVPRRAGVDLSFLPRRPAEHVRASGVADWARLRDRHIGSSVVVHRAAVPALGERASPTIAGLNASD